MEDKGLSPQAVRSLHVAIQLALESRVAIHELAMVVEGALSLRGAYTTQAAGPEGTVSGRAPPSEWSHRDRQDAREVRGELERREIAGTKFAAAMMEEGPHGPRGGGVDPLGRTPSQIEEDGSDESITALQGHGARLECFRECFVESYG